MMITIELRILPCLAGDEKCYIVASKATGATLKEDDTFYVGYNRKFQCRADAVAHIRNMSQIYRKFVIVD